MTILVVLLTYNKHIRIISHVEQINNSNYEATEVKIIMKNIGFNVIKRANVLLAMVISNYIIVNICLSNMNCFRCIHSSD